MLRLPARSVVRASIDQWTEEWIGWTFPPVERAISDAAWKPDSRADYCGRCGDSVGPGEGTDSGCGSCRDGAASGGGALAEGVIRLGAYTEVLRQWITDIKFRGWLEMGHHLGTLLGREVAASGVIDPERSIIVPAPMPLLRRVYRGMDHARVLAEGAGAELGCPIVPVLAKSNSTPQVLLSRTERRRAGGRTLRIRRRLGGWSLEGLQVVIIDDVRTTGATLRGAARLLRTLSPNKIVCAVAAVVDAPSRRDHADLADHDGDAA